MNSVYAEGFAKAFRGREYSIAKLFWKIPAQVVFWKELVWLVILELERNQRGVISQVCLS